MNEAQTAHVLDGLTRDIAPAVAGINRMSKLKALGSMVKTGIADMEGDAEKLVDRMVSLKQRGAEAFGKLHQELDAYEQAVAEAENSLAQTSNGGPPLGNS